MKTQAKALWGFVLALLVLGGISVATWMNVLSYQEGTREGERTVRVKNELERLLGHVRDVDSHCRGFALSGKDTFLVDHEATLRLIADAQENLTRMTGDNPQQQGNLERLKPLITARLAIAAELVATRRERGVEAAIELVREEGAKRAMERVQAAIVGTQ